jgi:hypothetical protein
MLTVYQHTCSIVFTRIWITGVHLLIAVDPSVPTVTVTRVVRLIGAGRAIPIDTSVCIANVLFAAQTFVAFDTLAPLEVVLTHGHTDPTILAHTTSCSVVAARKWLVTGVEWIVAHFTLT